MVRDTEELYSQISGVFNNLLRLSRTANYHDTNWCLALESEFAQLKQHIKQVDSLAMAVILQFNGEAEPYCLSKAKCKVGKRSTFVVLQVFNSDGELEQFEMCDITEITVSPALVQGLNHFVNRPTKNRWRAIFVFTSNDRNLVYYHMVPKTSRRSTHQDRSRATIVQKQTLCVSSAILSTKRYWNTVLDYQRLSTTRITQRLHAKELKVPILKRQMPQYRRISSLV